MAKQKICLACSGGGHLTEMLQLEGFYSKREHFFLTFKRPNSIDLSKTEKVFFVTDPKRDFFLLAKNFFESIAIFMREKPQVVLSTGAGIAVPICIIGKFFGAKIVFVESYCRTTSPSFSGRLIYPLADLFIVQWPDLLKSFPKAKYFGGFF